MKRSMIVAMNHRRVIGIDGGLPWHLPNELRYFRQITMGKAVIMGRKTYESIGKRPLPKRYNIVLTRQVDFQSPGCVQAGDLQEAMMLSARADMEEALIIGGGMLYEAGLSWIDHLYLTVVDNWVVGDIFFPCSLATLLHSGWQVHTQTSIAADAKHRYGYVCYQLQRTVCK